MKTIHYLKKPEYYLQPSKWLNLSMHQNGIYFDFLGLPIETFKGDYMERAIQRTGIYDIALTELVWQLSKPGGCMVDVGANIGYVSRIMAVKAGVNGKVVSVEPNPRLLPLLSHNRLATPNHQNWEIITSAAGASQGEANLQLPAEDSSNNGTATLVPGKNGASVSVSVTTLDHLFFTSGALIDLLKIDVEGFEPEVIKGASQLLQNHRVQHIVFEDFQPYPSASMQALEGFGYTIYSINKGWLGLALKPVAVPVNRPGWEEPNYLATLATAVQVQQMERLGYSCLRKKHRQQ